MKIPLVENCVNRAISHACYPLLCIRVDRTAPSLFKISDIRRATKFCMSGYCTDVICGLKSVVSNYRISPIA